MKNLIHWFRNLFRTDKTELSEELFQDLMRSLQKKHEGECDCNDVYALVDEYAEIQIKGEDAAKLMPLIREHMDTCRDCNEQYEALLAVLEKSKSE